MYYSIFHHFFFFFLLACSSAFKCVKEPHTHTHTQPPSSLNKFDLTICREEIHNLVDKLFIDHKLCSSRTNWQKWKVTLQYSKFFFLPMWSFFCQGEMPISLSIICKRYMLCILVANWFTKLFDAIEIHCMVSIEFAMMSSKLV